MRVSCPRSHNELMPEQGLLLLIMGRLEIIPMLKAIYIFYYKNLLQPLTHAKIKLLRLKFLIHTSTFALWAGEAGLLLIFASGNA